MNSIIIKGRLTANPELRKTTSDVSVCTFDVAVNRRFDKETADFFRCIAWRTAAETIAKYFTKGREILIRGEMQSRKWQDNDGNNRISWEIQIDEFEFCGNKSDSVTKSDSELNTVPNDTCEEKSDNLPF